MPPPIKTQKTFGTVRVDHFSPDISDGKPVPKAINVILSFEEALKVQIGLQGILIKLNSYDRSTLAGRAAGVNLCIYREQGGSITINEDKIKSPTVGGAKQRSDKSGGSAPRVRAPEAK